MKKPAKVSYYITLLLFVAFGIQAHAQRGLMVSTNGSLFNYPNFFDVNVEKMVSALNSVGYGGDDGSFSAKTNQANVFGNYLQQFLGPVLLGSTNLLDKINELQLGKLQQWDVLDLFGETVTWTSEAGDMYFYDGNQLQGMPFPRGLGTEWNIGIIGGQPQWVPNRYAYRDTNNAYAASQDFTGATITVPTQSDGTSNTTAASTAFVMRNRSSGAGSPYAALTNQPNAYSDLQTFAGGAAVGPTNLVTKLASLDSSKQNQDVDLDAVSALSGTGLIARTGSGTATNRSVAGDTEIVVTNGDGVAGNIVLSIGAAIARASALASYQAINSLLTALSGLSGNGILAKTGSGAVTNRTITGDTEIVVTNGDGVSGNPTLSAGPGIARTNNPTLTGTVTIPTQSDGTSNTTAASTAFVMRNRGGGGGSGNADTNSSTAWADSTSVSLYDLSVRGAFSVSDMTVSSINFSGIWGFANGAPGGTNADQTRTILGLVPDVDIQAFRLPLLQLYVALAADGDMPYRNASGIVTNVTSTTAGRTILSAASSAAQRAAMGVPDIAGDTFTGAIKVPYDAYSSGWTNNTKTNEVPTKRAIAEKIEALSVGGYISSVSTDFEVAGSQLGVTNTLGTGRLVRESATGAATAFNSLSDVSVATRDRGEQAWYDGTNWRNMPLASPVGNMEEWEDAYTSCATSTTQTPFTASAVNNGSSSINPTLWFRQGVYAPTTRLTSVDLFTGSVFAGSAASTWLTNRYIGKIEFVPSFTNSTVMIAGYSDRLNQAGLTNAPTDELAVTITNGVMRFVACTASASVSVASTTYTPATNLWHMLVIQGTNQVATVQVYTNSPTGPAIAWNESINSTNVPNGTSALLGFGFGAYGTGTASTNGTAIALVNQMGYRWQNKGLN